LGLLWVDVGNVWDKCYENYGQPLATFGHQGASFRRQSSSTFKKEFKSKPNFASRSKKVSGHGMCRGNDVNKN
jgi:hypothetical protein